MLAGVPSAALGQVFAPPERLTRGLFGGRQPLDPGRTRQELILYTNLLGGHDDLLRGDPPEGGDNIVAIRRPQSAYLAYGDVSLRYWLGKQGIRFLEVDGRGSMNTFRNIGITSEYGGEVLARAETVLGRRAWAKVMTEYRYSPLAGLESFRSISADLETFSLDANPTNTLYEDEFVTKQAIGAFGYRLTTLTSLEAVGEWRQRTFERGPSFGTSAATFVVAQSLGRRLTARGSFRHADDRIVDQEGRRFPGRDQTITASLDYLMALSPTRMLSLSVGGGAVRVDTIDGGSLRSLGYWAPSAHAAARLDFGRSWTASAEFKRSTAILYGVDSELGVSDAIVFRAGGFLTRRLQGVVAGGFASGRADRGIRDRGRNDSFAGAAQLGFRLVGPLSAVVSYSSFHYRLNQTASTALSVVPKIDRNAVRVGLAWAVPLFGVFEEGQVLGETRPTDGR
jgi:hypothetical protein